MHNSAHQVYCVATSMCIRIIRMHIDVATQ